MAQRLSKRQCRPALPTKATFLISFIGSSAYHLLPTEIFSKETEGKKEMENETLKGHLSAFITIVIWGTTFLSTKLLLEDFTPIEILLLRFLLGLLALLSICPKRLKVKNRKEELTFALAGLCGICLYYLLENIALTYTMASNVGVIICIAPFFTAILSQILIKGEERLHLPFFLGFLVSMLGICCISFREATFQVNPIGDILAIIAAFLWALYSLLTRKIGSYGYHTIQATKRIFAYGILFMLPAFFFFDRKAGFARFTNMKYLLHLLFLGLGASALCFVTWNYAVKTLGTMKTSVYIYMVPVITVAASTLVLHEKVTVISAVGTLLTLSGLFLSTGRLKIRLRIGKNKLK